MVYLNLLDDMALGWQLLLKSYFENRLNLVDLYKARICQVHFCFGTAQSKYLPICPYRYPAAALYFAKYLAIL